MRAPLCVLVLLAALVAPRASAQPAADPSLLVLEPIGAPDAATSAAITQALVAVGGARGYHVLQPGAGSVVGALDAGSSASLVGVVQRTGVHRALAVWVVARTTDYEVHVGLATQDGTATSIRRAASPAELTQVVATVLGELLPPPFVASAGVWSSPLLQATPAPVAAAPVYAAPVAPQPDYEPVAAPRRSRGSTGLLIAGAVVLGVGWIGGALIGLLGGYHDRTCITIGPSSCGLPPGTSWDPAWDNFRASSIVPIVGPWIQLAVKPSSDDSWPEWLVADGIIQGIGTILLIVGIAMVSGDGDDAPTALLIPSVGPDHASLTLLGSWR